MNKRLQQSILVYNSILKQKPNEKSNPFLISNCKTFVMYAAMCELAS